MRDSPSERISAAPAIYSSVMTNWRKAVVSKGIAQEIGIVAVLCSAMHIR
jgi:hypothetical protein